MMYDLNVFGINLLELNWVTVVVRLAFAMLCGSVLGIERTRKRRAAGMRTFILISDGSCLVMMISQFVNIAYAANDDLTRLGAQVISGIGFICAGTILLTGHHKVTGLTTAASLWAAASVGLAVGAGFYVGAGVMCVIMLITMFGLDGYRDRVNKSANTYHIYVVATDKPAVNRLVTAFGEMGFAVSELSPATNEVMDGVAFVCLLKSDEKTERKETLKTIGEMEGVCYVEEVWG